MKHVTDPVCLRTYTSTAACQMRYTPVDSPPTVAWLRHDTLLLPPAPPDSCPIATTPPSPPRCCSTRQLFRPKPCPLRPPELREVTGALTQASAVSGVATAAASRQHAALDPSRDRRDRGAGGKVDAPRESVWHSRPVIVVCLPSSVLRCAVCGGGRGLKYSRCSRGYSRFFPRSGHC